MRHRTPCLVICPSHRPFPRHSPPAESTAPFPQGRSDLPAIYIYNVGGLLTEAKQGAKQEALLHRKIGSQHEPRNGDAGWAPIDPVANFRCAVQLHRIDRRRGGLCRVDVREWSSARRHDYGAEKMRVICRLFAVIFTAILPAFRRRCSGFAPFAAAAGVQRQFDCLLLRWRFVDRRS